MDTSTVRSTAGGYHGRYLRVDMTTAAGEFVEIEDQQLRQFLGGSGLGTHLLLREQSASVDPLGAASALVVAFSPLVGSPLTTSAKFAVVCKSPLTDRINDSLASSGFAIAGKRTGCDALVITGCAREPSVLIVDDGRARIEPAGDLWGRNCADAQRLLRDRLGDGWQVASIGPAGERQVPFATISHDNRHAGRGGAGAVMGAKRLKAIAVRGTQTTPWAEPQQLTQLARRLSQKSFGPATEKYRELGTATNLLVFNRLNALPTRNFQQGSFEGAEALAPETLNATREKTRDYCAACTIGCEHIYALRNPAGDTESHGVRLEYENLFALGPLCGVDDADAVLRASRTCDELGLDTISAGGTIAFAMECVERGLWDVPWLQFGNADALQRAIELIGSGADEGALLALGSRRLAEEIGGGSHKFAPHVKGLEIPGYEPRALQTMALGFAVGTRGADHNRSGAYEVDFSDKVNRRDVHTDAVAHAIETEDRAALMDSLILCKFLRGVFQDLFIETAEMLQLVTGWDVSADELRETAHRIVTAKKQFNVLAGWRPDEDTLPERFLTEPLSDDPQAVLSAERLGELIRAYNVQRGWSDDGQPGQELLDRYGLV
jgi:aldehyde:ferredoxin oxidoreductase